MNDQSPVLNRHVVISGGGSGVGAAMARQFAEHGAKVSLLGRRADPLAKVAEQTGAKHQRCDVTDRDAVDAALKILTASQGPVDIAIANAGAAPSKEFGAMTVSDFNAVLAVNLVGVFNLWQACLQDMKGRGWGRLLAVASTAALKGYPYVTGYCAAKHGVAGLTRALATELGDSGVTANAICPGFTDTPLLDKSVAVIVAATKKTKEEAIQALIANNPQQRLIQPDEISNAALWLCTPGARSVNGHTMTLSGGEI